MFNIFKHKSSAEPQDQLSLFNQRSGQFFRVYRRHVYMKTTLMLFIGLGVAYTQGLFERENSTPYIQVLELNGPISGGSEGDGYRFSHRFLNATEDKRAKAILIRANSPGGSPAQSEIIFETLYEYTRAPVKDRKPVYVSIQDTCASPCIHALAPADFIAAHRSSVIGSIGVIFSGWDASGLLKKVGVERRALYLGENKAILDPFLASTETDNDKIETSLLTPMYQNFVGDMKRARGDRLSDTDNDLFSGLAWAGELALQRGLIDELESIIHTERRLESAVGVENYQSDARPQFTLLNLVGAYLHKWL